MKNYHDYHFNAESFGEYLPVNWEAICAWMNEQLDAMLTEEWMFDPSSYRGLSREGLEVVDRVWDWYWTGWITDAPVPEWEEGKANFS